jgi:hypothetical protein
VRQQQQLAAVSPSLAARSRLPLPHLLLLLLLLWGLLLLLVLLVRHLCSG